MDDRAVAVIRAMQDRRRFVRTGGFNVESGFVALVFPSDGTSAYFESFGGRNYQRAKSYDLGQVLGWVQRGIWEEID